MEEKQVYKVKTLQKVDTKSRWNASAIILEDKEIGYEKESGRYKIGDGKSLWKDLPYAGKEIDDEILSINNTLQQKANINLSNISNEDFKAKAQAAGINGGSGGSGSGVGQNTSDSGEIFNDYTLNKALAEYTHAEGKESVAGQKGYKMLEIKDAEAYDRFSIMVDDKDLPESNRAINNYSIGDLINFNGAQHHPEALKIYNLTCYSEEEPFSIIYVIVLSPFSRDNFKIETEDNKYENWINVTGKEVGVNIPAFYAAHAEGEKTKAMGRSSHAEGRETKVVSGHGHAEGKKTTAGYAAHAEGDSTYAIGDSSHAEGKNNKVYGESSHAEGIGNTVISKASHAEGASNTAKGDYSHAEGFNNEATNHASHAEGEDTHATGTQSHAEGSGSTASNVASHAEGNGTSASGLASHAEGSVTFATGDYSHAEGQGGHADGNCSHAEGENTEAKYAAHAEGSDTHATGDYSHAEGQSTHATFPQAHAEGYDTRASGAASHAEGSGTVASNSHAHAEGYGTIAGGETSHAEGLYTTASGQASHAEGHKTIASGIYQHVQGRFNIADVKADGETPNNKYAHIIGNGESDTERSNAHTLDWDGNAWFAGDVKAGEVSLKNIATSLEETNVYISDLYTNKANRTMINNDSSAVFEFEFGQFDNTETRICETKLETLSFIFADDVYGEDYMSGLSFDSGETPTSIDYTDSGILNWVGTDCVASNGLSIFQPSPNTHYDLVFYFNGTQIIGLVNGFVPSVEWQGALPIGNEAV